MNKSLYSVADAVAQVFSPPFTMATDREAIRAFTISVNDPASSINKSPHDYSLHRVAIFDDETGLVSAAPLMLVTAISVKAQS